DYEGRQKEIEGALDELEKKVVRTMMVEQRRRIDGRVFDQIRPISIAVGKLPRTHGSALFTRGENAGDCRCYSCLLLGRAENRRTCGRDFQVLYAPLQFPAILGR